MRRKGGGVFSQEVISYTLSYHLANTPRGRGWTRLVALVLTETRLASGRHFCFGPCREELSDIVLQNWSLDSLRGQLGLGLGSVQMKLVDH